MADRNFQYRIYDRGETAAEKRIESALAVGDEFMMRWRPEQTRSSKFRIVDLHGPSSSRPVACENRWGTQHHFSVRDVVRAIRDAE